MCYEHLKFEIEDEEISELYTDMENLVIEMDDELAGFFRLRIAVQQQPDGAWAYMDDENFQVWKRVIISAGFESGIEEVFSGYITRINPRFGSEPSEATLEISGIDNSVLMDQEEKLKAWPNKKDSDIAAEIFGLYGFTPEVENTEIVHDEEISTIIQRESDMQFLKRLARRNGFECFIEGTTGYFRKPPEKTEPQKVLAVHFGVETNVSNFSIDVNPLGPSNVAMSQVDRFNKTVLSVTADSSEQAPLGNTDPAALLPPGQNPAQTIVSRNTATGIPEMTALSRGQRRQSEWFVSGEGNINSSKYGHVLRPRGTVAIKGIGERYSGVYYVSHVTHTFSREGYTQHFRVKRDALEPTGSEDFSGGNGGFV